MPTHETTVAVHDWSPSRVAIDCVSKGTAISNGQAVIAACQVHVPSFTVLAPFGVANESFPTMLACKELPGSTMEPDADIWAHPGQRLTHVVACRASERQTVTIRAPTDPPKRPRDPSVPRHSA